MPIDVVTGTDKTVTFVKFSCSKWPKVIMNPALGSNAGPRHERTDTAHCSGFAVLSGRAIIWPGPGNGISHGKAEPSRQAIRAPLPCSFYRCGEAGRAQPYRRLWPCGSLRLHRGND